MLEIQFDVILIKKKINLLAVLRQLRRNIRTIVHAGCDGACEFVSLNVDGWRMMYLLVRLVEVQLNL